MSKSKRIINITHTDLDGVGCSIVLRCFFPDTNVVPYFCDYHNIDQTLNEVLDETERTDDIVAIFITDISFRKESGLAERINKLNKKNGSDFIILVDHHPTSGYLNEYSWAESHEKDDSGHLTCGTMWLYKILQRVNNVEATNTALRQFVTLVNEWDTWRWVTDYPEGQPHTAASDLNSLVYLYGKRNFVSEYTAKISNCSALFGTTEKAMIECKQQEIESDIKNKDAEMIVTPIHYRTKKSQLEFIDNYLKSNHMENMKHLKSLKYRKTFTAGVVYLSRNISDVGNALAEKHPELDFILIVNLPKTISLRSTKDLDVPLGIMANYLTGKGGGHPKSAGGVLKPFFNRRVAEYLIRTT